MVTNSVYIMRLMMVLEIITTLNLMNKTFIWRANQIRN